MDTNGCLKKVNSTAVFASSYSGAVFEGKWKDWFSSCTVCTTESTGEGNGEGNVPTPMIATIDGNGSSSGIEPASKVPSPAVVAAPVVVGVAPHPTVEKIVAATAPATVESAAVPPAVKPSTVASVLPIAQPAVESATAVAVLPTAHTPYGSAPTTESSPSTPPAAQSAADATAAVTREHFNTPQNAGEKQEVAAVISATPPAVTAPSVSSPLHIDVNTANGIAPAAALSVSADVVPVTITAASLTSDEKCLDAVVMEEKHVSPPITVAVSESVSAALPVVQSNEKHSTTKEQSIQPENVIENGKEMVDERIQNDSEGKEKTNVDLNDSKQATEEKEKKTSKKVNTNSEVAGEKEKGTNNETPTTQQDDLNMQKSCCFSFFGFNL
jgi:hypothetical protein